MAKINKKKLNKQLAKVKHFEQKASSRRAKRAIKKGDDFDYLMNRKAHNERSRP
jgi:hypothetical protein